MPRTKPVRKTRQHAESSDECDLLIKDFKKQTDLRLMKLDSEAKMAIKSFKTFVDLETSRIPSAIREMTLGEILGLKTHEDDQKENYNEESSSVNNNNLMTVPKTTKGKATKRITAVSDDGYVTESTGPVKRQSRARKISTNVDTVGRTRSSSRSSRAKLSEIDYPKTATKGRNKALTTESSTNADKFKTPAIPKPNMDYNTVTPKVKPNTPMSVLRRPRQGETVISMQGSPLLVSAIVKEDTANINVPLSNGNVMSLLPTEGLRMSHVPTLDAETKRQLETLKSHIDKVISYK